MSDTVTPSDHTVRSQPPPPAATGANAWKGWVVFASVILIMVGAFQAVAGITALLRNDFFLVAPSGLAVEASYTTWGWVHLTFGVVAAATGSGLLSGRMWARVLAVLIAALSTVVNLAFVPAYPVWSLLVITLDVIVIYAVVVHGDELAT